MGRLLLGLPRRRVGLRRRCVDAGLLDVIIDHLADAQIDLVRRLEVLREVWLEGDDVAVDLVEHAVELDALRRELAEVDLVAAAARR